jgi:chromosome segregation ATPase
MIEWLDEERRRDKATIARLEEKLLQQQEFLEGLTRKLGGVENDQTSLRGMFLPVGRDVDLLELIRIEMRQNMDGLEARRVAAERESDRRAEILRENLTRPLRDMADRMDELESALGEMPAQRVERDRIINVLNGLQQRVEEISKRLEEPERRITFLEEQRRQDSRRLSELQSEVPETKKQLDALRPKVELLEELTVRNEKRIGELQGAERERREAVQQFMDQQTLLVQQRDQRMEEVNRQLGRYDEEMKRNMERFESWSEAYRQMKKLIEDFERLGDRLDRRINELAEMQRLSEERFRTEWNAWTSDDQKRWKSFTLTNDETWRQHDKDFELLSKRVGELGGHLAPMVDSLERLWRLMRAQASLYRDQYSALVTEHETGAERLPSVRGLSGSGGRP